MVYSTKKVMKVSFRKYKLENGKDTDDDNTDGVNSW